MRMPRAAFAAALSSCLVLFGSGCGKKTADVSGKVTFADGKDVPTAQITFTNEKGLTASGSVNNGKYTVKKVPVGEEVKVTVSTKQIMAQIKEFDASNTAAHGPDPNADRRRTDDKTPDNLKDKVSPEEQKRKEMLDQQFKDRSEHMKAMKEMKGKLVPVPDKFETLDKTPIKVKVTGGSQEIDIKLE